MKNYQAQTPQNLALTIILQKIQENKYIPGQTPHFPRQTPLSLGRHHPLRKHPHLSRHPLGRHPLPSDTMGCGQQAVVRILLESMLVSWIVTPTDARQINRQSSLFPMTKREILTQGSHVLHPNFTRRKRQGFNTWSSQ